MWRKNLLRSLQISQRFKVLFSNAVPLENRTEVDSDINIFKKDGNIHGFHVKDIRELEEHKAKSIYLIHDKIKCEYLHLYRNDDNNNFSINFLTIPMNDSGEFYILKRLIENGSKFYPVRDLFNRIKQRSIAGFIDTIIQPDCTIYSFSTTNYNDFKNLQKIYLDSVFAPSLIELDFKREGWRFQHDHKGTSDLSSDLIISGTAYNEAKSALFDNNLMFENYLQSLLLPDNTYNYLLKGNPFKMTNLTLNSIKKIYEIYYHPSNAKFFSYGNFPLAPTLEYLNEEYLKKYEEQFNKISKVNVQNRWIQSKDFNIKCRFEKSADLIENENTVAISLLLSDIRNVQDIFILRFLCELLLKDKNGLFYQFLLKEKLANGFTRNTGFNNQLRDTFFTVGLHGVKKEDFHKIPIIFDETINILIDTGFDKTSIENVYHNEFQLNENFDNSNQGFYLLRKILPTWIHEGDFINLLQSKDFIDNIKKFINEDTKFLNKMLMKFFKNNKHRLLLTMSPDIKYVEEQLNLENKFIKNSTNALTNEEKNLIKKFNDELYSINYIKQNQDKLPTLTIEDVNNDVDRINIKKITIESIPIQINYIDSNDMIYFKSILSTAELSPEQQILLPLFCFVMSKIKINDSDYIEWIDNHPNCFRLTPFIGESLFHLHIYEPGILISSCCLKNNLNNMWSIWNKIFHSPQIQEKEQLKVLVRLYINTFNNFLYENGHLYAMLASSGLISAGAFQRELFFGLPQIAYIKQLMKTDSYKAMLDEIYTIANIVFNKKNMRSVFNLSEENQSDTLKSFEDFIKNLPMKSRRTNKIFVQGKMWSSIDFVQCQHHIYNFPFNFCSKSILTTTYSNKHFASLSVLGELLTQKYLQLEVVQKQYAQNCGAHLNMDGVFVFYAKHCLKNYETLDIFDNATQWMQENFLKLTEQDLLEAKFGVLKYIDRPVAAHNKGCQEFFRKLTFDMMQRQRAQIMSVSLNSIKRNAENYLDNNKYEWHGKIIIGPKNKRIENKKRTKELWTVVDN